MTDARGRGLSRRSLLQAGAAAAAGSLFFPAVVRAEWKSIANVVIVRFGGGVRYQETFGDPLLANLPQMRSLLKEGTLYQNVYNEGDTSHVGATTQLLTGRPCPPSRIDKTSPLDPTIFECLRKEKGRRIGPEKCVVVDHSTVDFHYNYSKDPQFGFDLGGYCFRPRLITYHALNDVIANEQDQNNDVCKRARALQALIWVTEDYEHIEDPAQPPARFDEAGTRFVKDTFARDKVPIVKSGDDLVWYFARSLMEHRDFTPKVLVLNFAGPDVAHGGSFSAYVEKIRELDDLVGSVHNAVMKKVRGYAGSTLLIVTPDVGRSLQGEGSGGFVNHRTGDEGCRHLWALFLGPGVPKNRQVTGKHSQYDIAATVGNILGFSIPGGEGKVMPELEKG
jgi:hypothetical protein